jgi:NTP pyrophosphatase (non-canonical NTP hydrolase)
MGKFKDVGKPELALAEEMAEAIQVITKLHRFGGYWNEIPEDKNITRWEDLCNEMEDVIYQWNRLKELYDQYNTDETEPQQDYPQ